MITSTERRVAESSESREPCSDICRSMSRKRRIAECRHCINFRVCNSVAEAVPASVGPQSRRAVASLGRDELEDRHMSLLEENHVSHGGSNMKVFVNM